MAGDGIVTADETAIDGLLAAALRGEAAAWPDGWPAALAVERIAYHGIAGLIAAETRALGDWPAAVLAPVREQAIALLRAGADVFHHNADAAALGVFQAVKASKTALIFGANEDQASLAPANVPGSAVIDLPKAFLLIGKQLVRGDALPTAEEFGLEEDVVRYVANPAFAVPPALAARVAAAADSIKAGTLRPLGPAATP